MQKSVFIFLVFVVCLVQNLNAQLFNNSQNNSPLNMSIDRNTTEPNTTEPKNVVEKVEEVKEVIENTTNKKVEAVKEVIENTTNKKVEETDITEDKMQNERNTTAKNTTKKRKKTVVNKDRPLEKASSAEDRLIFEIAHANWNNKPVNLNLDWYSRSFNAYFMYDFDLNGNRNVSFAPGIGLGTTIMSHNNLLSVDTANVTRFIQFSDTSSTSTFNYSRNNLVTAYFDIPIEFRFRTNPDKNGRRWKLALGFKAGYLFNSHTKYVGDNFNEVDGTLVKEKIYRLQNINNFRYGPTVRFGYGNFNLIGFYSLSTLFEKGTAERDINPFYIGFSYNSL